MISYHMGNRVKLGQVAYATPYPPGGLEWGQGWGRFASSSPKVVLPRSPNAGGGVGYASEGTVLTQQDIEEISAVSGQNSGAGVVPGPTKAGAPTASGPSTLSIAAAGVAATAILAAFVL